MEKDLIKDRLHSLGRRRRRITQEAASVRLEIHEAALQASAAGWNNQQIAELVGVTREIIRRHVGPVRHEEQERS